MKIKKFTAKTFAEALELVKKELGSDAMLLSTEEKKGFRPHVEVTAAVDYEPTATRNTQLGQRGNAVAKTTPETHERSSTASFGYGAYAAAADSDGQDSGIRGELSSLRAMIESMRSNGYEMALPQKKRAMLEWLRERRVREDFALRLCDRGEEISQLQTLISSDIRIRRDSSEKKAIMFVGPTGVGKTTTIAKLAARAVKEGKKAAVINLDTWRIGAVEQMRIYSRVLGIPLTTATTPAEFYNSLNRYAQSRDVVFIDTTGRSYRDEQSIRDIAGLCNEAPLPIELHLLMGANADDECMIDAHRVYRQLPIDYIGFSKLDEAVRYGGIYNLMLTYQKPVAWLGTGQRVPGDIEAATVGRLAGLITMKECATC